MASDTRLNYFNDRVIDGNKYQEIVAIADCIQKTFFLKKAGVGIQFLGIGYLLDGNEKYPISHFYPKLEGLGYVKNFRVNCSKIFEFFSSVTQKGDTGNYVKGVMAGFKQTKAYVCLFNTFNNDFRVQELLVGQFIDSEGNGVQLSPQEETAKGEIVSRIKDRSKIKWWTIGDVVEILKITEKEGDFILKSSSISNLPFSELIEKLRASPELLSGRIIQPPHYEKYNFENILG